MSFLEIKGLRKSYGAVEVLRGIDLAVEQHQVVCLIGASGCGKSTLLRCVNALEHRLGDPPRLRGRHLPDLREPQHDVAQRGQVREQVEALKHHADVRALAGQRRFGQPCGPSASIAHAEQP